MINIDRKSAIIANKLLLLCNNQPWFISKKFGYYCIMPSILLKSNAKIKETIHFFK